MICKNCATAADNAGTPDIGLHDDCNGCPCQHRPLLNPPRIMRRVLKSTRNVKIQGETV